MFVEKNKKAKCLYGVVSYGPIGCRNGTSVFTRVSEYKDWILEVITKNN